MSTRGQSIAAAIQPSTASRVYPTCAPKTRPGQARGANNRLRAHLKTRPGQARRVEAAAGSGSFVVGNLVAIAACLTAVLAASLATAPRAAAEGAAARPHRAVSVPAFVTPGEVRAGALLLKSENDRYVEAPLVATDVDLVVSGPTARARVSQIFHNPTDGWIEAVYVYPLPEGGAVDTLKMVIGDRIIVGDIDERKKAREAYEQAKSAGQKASLVEQERPNIFTNSVANIGPRETVVVQIEYQEPVRQSGNEFSLRVPLVVAPRYMPAPILQTVDLRADGQGWGQTSDPVPDRDRIAPPVLDPRWNIPVNPVAVTVRLSAGFPLAEVKSHHHAVTTETTEEAYARHQARRRRGAGGSRLRADLEAAGEREALGRPVPRARRRRRLPARLRDAAPVAAQRRTAPARDRVRHRQFRLHGRHLDRAGQGEPDLCARPAGAVRPLQRHPLRQHHGRALPRHGRGRRHACRTGQGVRVRAGGPRRHRDGAADAGGADRPARRRLQISSARWSSSRTAASATSSNCSRRSAPCAGARASSWSASAPRPTRS